jgi:hypothetical protein
MTFLQTLKDVFTRPWFVRGEKATERSTMSQGYLSDPSSSIEWRGHTFFVGDDRARELRLLEHQITNLRELVEKAKRQKKAHKKHEARLKQLMWKRASLSGT